MNVCCFKPLSWWSSVTAAVGNTHTPPADCLEIHHCGQQVMGCVICPGVRRLLGPLSAWLGAAIVEPQRRVGGCVVTALKGATWPGVWMVLSPLPSLSILSGMHSLGAPCSLCFWTPFCTELKVASLSLPSTESLSTGNSRRVPRSPDGIRKLWECRVNTDQKSPVDKARLCAPRTHKWLSHLTPSNTFQYLPTASACKAHPAQLPVLRSHCASKSVFAGMHFPMPHPVVTEPGARDRRALLLGSSRVLSHLPQGLVSGCLSSPQGGASLLKERGPHCSMSAQSLSLRTKVTSPKASPVTPSCISPLSH